MTRTYRIVIFSCLALFLLLGSREFRLKKADFLSSYLFYPFISSVNWLESQFNLKRENQNLYNMIAQNQQELNKLNHELDKYRKQNLEFSAPVYEHITADVIGSNGNYGQRYYILDKGSLAGIKKNMPVLGTDGIIGKIISTGPNYSLLMPFSHNNFKLGVMLEKNFLHGLLESDLEGRTYMSMIRVGSEVSLGDTIVTSHFSSTFPAFYPVGTVSRLRTAPDKLNLSAEIRPFSNIQSMTTVIVLKYENVHNFQEELELDEEIKN